MLRYAAWAMALALSFGLTAGSAHARRSHVDVFVAIGNRPAFVHPFFHPFFFHRSFHSAFFVGAPVFAPPVFVPPVIGYYLPPPAIAYYAPPQSAYQAPPPPPAAPSRSENCRQYQTTIDIDGQPQPLVGTICKGPDGNWHTVQGPWSAAIYFFEHFATEAHLATGKALRRTASMGSVAAAAFALSGCGLGGPAHGPPAANAAAVVDMGFESYSPFTLTIRTGETVEWRNTSLITHTVTDDPSRAKNSSDAVLPPDAQPFDSGDIAAGQVYLRAFTVPGMYHYFCRRHEDDGMVGTVVVMPAS